MSHTIRDQAKLLARVRRLRGQMEGVERALQSEAPCGEVLRQLASIRGALSGLTAEIVEDHLKEHIVEESDRAAREVGFEELATVLRTYLR